MPILQTAFKFIFLIKHTLSYKKSFGCGTFTYKYSILLVCTSQLRIWILPATVYAALADRMAPSSGKVRAALHPLTQQLEKMGFKVTLLCAALLFFLIDFQYNTLSSPLNALVPFYYVLTPLLKGSLASRCNGSMPMTKCFNLTLIRCHIHGNNNQEGEYLECWSADRLGSLKVCCVRRRRSGLEPRKPSFVSPWWFTQNNCGVCDMLF